MLLEVGKIVPHGGLSVDRRIVLGQQFPNRPEKLRRRLEARAEEARHRYPRAHWVRQHSVLHAFEPIVRYKLKGRKKRDRHHQHPPHCHDAPQAKSISPNPQDIAYIVHMNFGCFGN